MKKRLFGFAAALALSPSFVFADTVVCNAGGCTTPQANVGLQVIVPGFVRFQLGAAAATPSLVWAFDGSDAGPLTSADLGAGPVAPSSQANTGSATAGEIAVVLQSNLANDATVTLTNTDGGGFDANIGFANITVASGTIPAPATAVAASNGPNTIGAGGIINATDTWTFSYANGAVPPAGNYTATLHYTVAIP